MNKLVSIGIMGDRICFLNISKEQAIERYTEITGKKPKDFEVEEFEFSTCFWAYNAAALDEDKEP